MKKNISRYLLLMLMIVFTLFITSCDGKTPEKGYVSAEYVYENIISKIDSSVTYDKYSVKGTFNYLGMDKPELPREISKNKLDFIDTEAVLQKNASTSYFLRLPLHVTKENWLIYDAKGAMDLTSAKYVLESKIYQPAGGYLDTIYYYERPEGGFYLKAFGVNKSLKIYKPTEIASNAKWNVICEYDANGFLLSETFETLNAHEAPDTETIYGKATYTYFE